MASGLAQFRRLLIGSSALFRVCTASMSSGGASRLPPLQPPHLDEAQQQLYDDITQSRIKVVGKEAVFDEQGGLRGPWMAEVVSPHLGKHLERLATAVRVDNSLEPRLYEVAILVVGVHWRAQFEWFAHEKLARKAGVNEAAFELIKSDAPPESLAGILRADELAVYTLARELMTTKRVSPSTYQTTKALLGDSDVKMADLCMSMGCYSAVSKILNMFEVPLPAGHQNPFLEP